MHRPVWFLLVEQWRTRKMGQTGITLPFLVGALSLSRNQSPPTRDKLAELLHQMRDHPYPGYVVEVRWCAAIGAPVFTVDKSDQPEQMPYRHLLRGRSGEPSIGLSYDLVPMLHCDDSAGCLDRLIELSVEIVESGKFSRIKNAETGGYEYGHFSNAELQYIEDVVDGCD